MTASIQLPFWPSTLDNIRWSSDNLIAVSGGEFMAVLVPQIKPRHTSDPAWQIANFKVTGFTQQEVLLVSPLSRKNWSLGEELSQQYILDHAWSAPDLGHLGSCVLAILHSNQVLTLWEYHGQPLPSNNWKRAFIINHTIKDHLQVRRPAQSQPTELQQVRQRVRSFAWLRHDRSTSDFAQGENNQRLRANHIMAVATDDGQIFILGISSPYDVLQPAQTSWNAQVLLEIDCNDVVRKNGASSNKSMLPRTRIDSLVWGDDFHGGQAVLYFIADQQLFSLQIRLMVTVHDAINHSVEISITNPPEGWSRPEKPISGPLRCRPGTNEPVYFTSDTLHVSDKGNQAADTTLVTIDTAWSEISGMSIAGESREHQLVAMSSHFASEHLKTPFIQLTASCAKTVSPASWQQTAKLAMSAYAADLDTTSRILTRNWGLATSPAHELVATCSTMVPAESAVHIIASDQLCTIDICEMPRTDSAQPKNHCKPLPSEVLVCVIWTTEKQCIELLQADPTNEDAKQYIMARLHEGCREEKALIGDEPVTEPTILRSVADLKTFFAKDKTFRQQKIERLYSLAVRQESKIAVPKEAYSSLVEVVTSMSYRLPTDGLISKKIISVYQAARRALRPERATETSEDDMERCSLCDEGIAFEAFKWARCASGHQFIRCSLTLLVIPQPGVSKSCGICDARYLNEHKIDDLSTSSRKITPMQPQQEQEFGKHLTNALARIMFTAAERCIFCGGKFIA